MSKSGQLEVRVLCARDLKDVETFGRNDPFFKVMVGSNQPWRSRTAKDAGKKPVWNEANKFSITPKDGLIRVEVWDDNVVSSDQLIGSGSHPLQNVLLRGSESVRLLIVDKNGRTAGELEMTLVFTPDGKAAGQGGMPGYGQPGVLHGQQVGGAAHYGHSPAYGAAGAVGAQQGYPGAAPAGYPGAAPAGHPGAAPAGYPGAAPVGHPGQQHAPQPVHTQQTAYGAPPSYHTTPAGQSQGYPGQHSAAPQGYPVQQAAYPQQGAAVYPQAGAQGYPPQAGGANYAPQGYPAQPAGYPGAQPYGAQPGGMYPQPQAASPYAAPQPYGAQQQFGGPPPGGATYPPANIFGAPPSL